MSAMKQIESSTALIVGYSDQSGPEEYNLERSHELASSIANYMIGSGISQDRLFAEGRGIRDENASTQSLPENWANRHGRMVQIQVLSHE